MHASFVHVYGPLKFLAKLNVSIDSYNANLFSICNSFKCGIASM